MISAEKVFFKSGGRQLAGNLIYTQAKNKLPIAIFLHGGGQANKERFRQWQEVLAKENLGSLAFDFIGVGESEGNFEDGTLDQRLADAHAALVYIRNLEFVDSNRLGLIAASLGAHVACRLVEKELLIRALFLSGAAAYGEEAENKKLNDEFRFTIRQENSWAGSPAFKALENYAGALMVAYGENDEVVPTAVQEKYLSLAKSKGQTLILKGVGHKLLTPKGEESDEARQKVYQESLKFFKSNL